MAIVAKFDTFEDIWNQDLEVSILHMYHAVCEQLSRSWAILEKFHDLEALMLLLRLH